MRCFATVALAGLAVLFLCGADPAEKPAAEAPAVEAKGFEFRVAQVTLNRSFNYDTLRPGGPQTKSENIRISFALYGPEEVDIYRADDHLLLPGRRPPAQAPAEDLLSAMKDGDGNDLRDPDTGITFGIDGPTSKEPNADKARFHGTLRVSLKPPPGGSKVLSLVEGYVVVEQTLETGKLEVKPLKDDLQKELALPGGVLRFTTAADKTIKYEFTPKKLGGFFGFPIDRLWHVSCFGPDGVELQVYSESMGRDGKKLTMTKFFRQPLPDGAYAVVTYPAKVQKVKIPFKAENVQLP